MQNSMVIAIFSVFDWEYAFGANLLQNIKIVNSRWNLILNLIQIWRNNGDVHVFWFWLEILCLRQLVQKIKIVSLRWNLIPRLIRICWIQWCCSLFFVFDRKRPSWANLVQIVNIYSFFCFRSEMLFFGKIWSKMSKLSV